MNHDLVLVTCAPTLGWWAECGCGWISRGRYTEEAATLAHERHQAREAELDSESASTLA